MTCPALPQNMPSPWIPGGITPTARYKSTTMPMMLPDLDFFLASPTEQASQRLSLIQPIGIPTSRHDTLLNNIQPAAAPA